MLDSERSLRDDDRLVHSRYSLRSQFFRLFGGAYRLYTDSGELALYLEKMRFRLEEDIRLYEDEAMQRECLKTNGEKKCDGKVYPAKHSHEAGRTVCMSHRRFHKTNGSSCGAVSSTLARMQTKKCPVERGILETFRSRLNDSRQVSC